MTRRHAWLHGTIGLSAWFTAGCMLLGGGGDSRDTRAISSSKEPIATVEVASADPPPAGETAAPSLPNDVLSNYHPVKVAPRNRVAGTTAEAKKDTARLEVKPSETSTPVASAPGGSEASEPSRAAPEAPLVKALRCALEKHPDQARQLLDKYDKGDRELLLALVRLTASAGEGDLEKLPPEEVASTLDKLHGLTTSLRQRAPLSLEKVCFCKKIDGFGQYEPMPAGHEFQAGVEGRPGERVQVYAEVRNFSSVPRENQFETCLASRLEICDADRNQVASMDLGTCTDRSQTPRHDYFLNFQLHVPARLAPGLYTLWVVVKDVTPRGPGQPAGREARSSLDLKVSPSANAPAKVQQPLPVPSLLPAGS